MERISIESAEEVQVEESFRLSEALDATYVLPDANRIWTDQDRTALGSLRTSGGTGQSPPDPEAQGKAFQDIGDASRTMRGIPGGFGGGGRDSDGSELFARALKLAGVRYDSNLAERSDWWSAPIFGANFVNR